VPFSGALEDRYASAYRTSSQEAQGLKAVLAGGAAHDSWRMEPFCPLTVRAAGALKWTIDDRPLIDYWMGHGALLCGHGFPPVVEAVRQQATLGLHFGGSHPLQIRWAELIRRLISGAEATRFTSSGTEGTLLSLRTARAFTGRNVIVKFDGHFHGWHDDSLSHFMPAEESGFDLSSTEEVRVASPGDIDSVRQVLDSDVAAIILEPGGGGSGALPWSAQFLGELSELSLANGSLLIFDETVSGFRYSPGGVQALCGVRPDLTVLGKILTGGLPGGAISGTKDVMSVFGAGTERNGRRIRVPHTGTFNANPLSAAAGVAMLEQIADGSHQRLAHEAADQLVLLVNEYAAREGVDVFLFQQGGIFHIAIGAERAGLPAGPSAGAAALPGTYPDCYRALRLALLIHGVDSHPVHGWLSSAHTGEILTETAKAFGEAFADLRQLSLLPLRGEPLAMCREAGAANEQ
jgi:glutamate-1-semialdehyde 2,1-aminomutase